MGYVYDHARPGRRPIGLVIVNCFDRYLLIKTVVKYFDPSLIGFGGERLNG